MAEFFHPTKIYMHQKKFEAIRRANLIDYLVHDGVRGQPIYAGMEMIRDDSLSPDFDLSDDHFISSASQRCE